MLLFILFQAQAEVGLLLLVEVSLAVVAVVGFRAEV